jgi:hypothetical protein
MHPIIAIFFALFLPVFSLKHAIPKLCIHCKHFISDNNIGTYGKCALFPKEENNANYLVTGIAKNTYYYCSTVRNANDMCGIEGKHYKKNKLIADKKT